MVLLLCAKCRQLVDMKSMEWDKNGRLYCQTCIAEVPRERNK